MDALMSFYDECRAALEAGVTLEAILDSPIRETIARLREVNSEGFVPKKEVVTNDMKAAIQKLIEAVD
jgi:hypothetical protein